MAELNQVYKCTVCGNIVEVVHDGEGELVCCGRPMELKIENTEDAAEEKHVPVIEKTAKGILIKVGSVPHPMEKAHYIEWIEILVDGKSYKEFLKPGGESQTEFCVEDDSITARVYCNLHGLWKSK